jgi:hypothetical protein
MALKVCLHRVDIPCIALDISFGLVKKKKSKARNLLKSQSWFKEFEYY